MAIRPIRVGLPPSTGTPSLDWWMREVTNAINGLPISVFSTSGGPNASFISAPQGFIGFETGSSVTPLWVRRFSNATSWSALSVI